MADALPEAPYLDAIRKLTQFLDSYRPEFYDKDAVVKAFAKQWNFSRERAVYYDDTIAFRFSHVKTHNTFSNTIAGLSRLRNFDDRPFVVVVVRNSGIQLLIANSSFVTKISHTSDELRLNKLVGSFNGYNIMRAHGGIANAPENFERLFLLHRERRWEENAARIIEASAGIRPRGRKFEPSPEAIAAIQSAPELAAAMSDTAAYKNIELNLDAVVESKRNEIIKASQMDNPKRRGDQIECIISETVNEHHLEDLRFELSDGTTVLVDIKSKILGLQSNPKAYNIDKALSRLSEGSTTLSFYFVGVDRVTKSIRTKLVSIFDSYILKATSPQRRWASRRSRGSTQLVGDISRVFEPEFTENVDVAPAQAKLMEFLALKRRDDVVVVRREDRAQVEQ